MQEWELMERASNTEPHDIVRLDEEELGRKGVMEWWESDFYADGDLEEPEEWIEEGTHQIQPTPEIHTVLTKNSAVEHLLDIATLQKNIMSLLKEIEQKNRGNKKCSAKDLKEQQEAISNMQTALGIKVPQLAEQLR